MTNSTISLFLAGAATFGLVLSSVFFVRFWVRTRDLLFAAFGVAFLLLAANQALLALGDIPLEYRSWVYLLRVAAFALLIAAIAWKNMPRQR